MSLPPPPPPNTEFFPGEIIGREEIPKIVNMSFIASVWELYLHSKASESNQLQDLEIQKVGRWLPSSTPKTYIVAKGKSMIRLSKVLADDSF